MKKKKKKQNCQTDVLVGTTKPLLKQKPIARTTQFVWGGLEKGKLPHETTELEFRFKSPHCWKCLGLQLAMYSKELSAGFDECVELSPCLLITTLKKRGSDNPSNSL